MFAAPAVAFAMWRHCKPEEHGFINVPEQDIQEDKNDEPEDVIEEVTLEHQEKYYEPEDVIEEVALEHQEQDIPERNEDEPEEVTREIAPIYQGGYRYLLYSCFPISRKGSQQQVRAKAKHGENQKRPCPHLSLEISLAVHHAQLKKFLWWELHAATDNFNKNNILGRGAFGSVYKGRLVDGSLVAVKRQKERTSAADLQFQTEVTMISMETKTHRNLLRLHGFCMTPTERLLVYPYIVNGSVASWLYDRQLSEPPLDWDTRRRIAVGSARGLSCLHDHCDPKIIHRDVKAANILLDEDFEAIVSDFGCAKLMGCNDAHETTVCGTIGHIAPEYRSTGNCSENADVFSYGIMLLELITGKKAYDPARSANYVMLLDWVTRLFREKKVDEDFEMLVDPDLLHNYNKTEVESLVQVALLCTEASPSARPPMSDVLKLLEGDGLEERWEQWLLAGMGQQFAGSTSSHPDEQFVPYTKIRSVELSGPR